MDNLIGQRFSLISKSEIRYVGTLHEINPEQSTIALEEVFSFGTEDRAVPNFIPPSQQKFEYIVFRGSDVKDIKIEEEAKEPPKPQFQPPDDPAILNSSRPGPAQPSQGPTPGPPSNRGESPFPPQPYPPPGYGFYPPPPPGQFGRGYGPPPGNFGPGPGFPPYGPPPPGYFGPPGQGFPQGPNRFPPHQQPSPIGPPGQQQPHHGQADPGQQQQQQHQQPPAPGPPSAPAEKQTTELPVEKTTSKKDSKPTTPAPAATMAQRVDLSKPAPVSQPSKQQAQQPTSNKAPQTQPKSNRIAPAMPFTVNQKSFTPPVANEMPQTTAQQQPAKPAKSQAEMEEASRQAKEAVANALAKLQPSQPATQTNMNVETITERVSQMTTGPPSHRGRGGYRGQRGGRSASGGQKPKMEIPQSDFDFESSNAKFNKEDLIKEAIASGSPLGETPEENAMANLTSTVNGTSGPVRKDSLPQNPIPYNKASSFFDNISSDSRDREESTEARFNPRAQRGAEFKKNVETFGQGNVDSGYRGRGRGGYRGQRRGYGQSNNYRGGYRGRGRGQSGDDGTGVPNQA